MATVSASVVLAPLTRVAPAPRNVASAPAAARSSGFMGGRAVLSTSTSTVSFSRSSLRVCAKGKSQNRKVPGKAGPSSQFRLPPLDPNNPQFMIYVRSKAVPMWYPVSVITGGSTAKNLVNAAEGNFASDFFRNALTKNMADVVYKDEKAIRNLVYRSYSLLKQAKALEWGYKMLDPADAERSMKPTGVQLIPAKEDIKESPVEGAVNKVRNLFGGGGDK